MPIYEYRCDSCSYQFEVKQSMKDDALTTCERCGKSLRRLISSSGIMFKGSGWYVTDYSNKLKPPSEGEKTPAAAGEKKEAAAGSSTGAAGESVHRPRERLLEQRTAGCQPVHAEHIEHVEQIISRAR